MKKDTHINSGKTKSLFSTDHEDDLIIEFRNDTTSFDGKKFAQLNNKGMINNYFNAFIMEKLSQAHIPTHFKALLSHTESVVRKLDMLPIEFVVRNISAGSLCKRIGIKEGMTLRPPLFELFLKNDSLGDPLINEDYVTTFNWGAREEIIRCRELTFQVNTILQPLFLEANILLVDYKLEFGRSNGELFLGDEFTPDGCRLWDSKSREKLDKDRFRQNLGQVIESYEVAGRRLGINFPHIEEGG